MKTEVKTTSDHGSKGRKITLNTRFSFWYFISILVHPVLYRFGIVYTYLYSCMDVYSCMGIYMMYMLMYVPVFSLDDELINLCIFIQFSMQCYV